MFESIIFLFVMHPFDVGDRCEIDGVQVIFFTEYYLSFLEMALLNVFSRNSFSLKFQMVVEEMNILTTVFLRFDNQKLIYM